MFWRQHQLRSSRRGCCSLLGFVENKWGCCARKNQYSQLTKDRINGDALTYSKEKQAAIYTGFKGRLGKDLRNVWSICSDLEKPRWSLHALGTLIPKALQQFREPEARLVPQWVGGHRKYLTVGSHWGGTKNTSAMRGRGLRAAWAIITTGCSPLIL